LDFVRIIEEAEQFIETQGFDKSNLAKKLGFHPRYISDIKAGKSKKPGSDFVLALINRLNFNPIWLETGSGEMFLTPKEEKHPLIIEFEHMMAQNVEDIEKRLSELEDRLKGVGFSPSGESDFDLYALEPEPEYDEIEQDIVVVEGIAAGKPIYQSDVRATISVPKRYIKTKPEDYYVGRINGTSMTGAGIPDGCLALFRISDMPRNGAIQIVEYHGEATLKRMREVPGKGWKICFEDYTNRVINIGPGDEFHIQGDFVAVLPDYLGETIHREAQVEDTGQADEGK
jgi:SOS-response transcriptional repressor LexA